MKMVIPIDIATSNSWRFHFLIFAKSWHYLFLNTTRMYIKQDIIYILFSICGEPFQAWEMWLSPHSKKPVGSEVGGQDPHQWIGSPMGNQACIVSWLLWDLLLLKLLHCEASKCLLSIFIFLKSGLDLPDMDLAVWTTSPFTLQIFSFDVFSDTLSLVCKR